MPKVNLTREAKIEDQAFRLAASVLDVLNADQGKRRMDNKEYAEFHSKGERFITQWNRKKLKGVAFDEVFKALIRAGYHPRIVFEEKR